MDIGNFPTIVLVVKKAMRVSPRYFRNIGSSTSVSGRREDLLHDLHKVGLFESIAVFKHELYVGFHNQFHLWKLLSHPNLVTLYFVASKELALFQEYCENGGLREYLRKDLSEIEYICIIRDILRGIAYLHGHNPPVAHGRINPGKNYMGRDGAKLGEFGLSHTVAGFPNLVPSINVTGIARWMSPEYFDSLHPGSMTIPGDMWSFGCTLLEIATGLVPYHETRYDIRVVAKILSGVQPGNPESERYTNRRELSPEYIKLTQSFITRCWQPIEKRPSSQSLLGKIETFKTPEPADHIYHRQATSATQELFDTSKNSQRSTISQYSGAPVDTRTSSARDE